MSVLVDCSTISALLFSHLNSKGSQYGFLFGEKVEQIEEKISDSQINGCDLISYMYVSSFIPWPSQECPYDRSGHIKSELMQHNFPNTEQKLVGWYSFRHRTTSRPSLRENTLHKNLERFTGQSQDFLFFLCTSSSSTDMSIHTCNYGFMQANNGCNSFDKSTLDVCNILGNVEGVASGRLLINLPVSVINLGDTTRQEYKKSSAILSNSKTFQGLLQGYKKNFLNPSGEMEQTTKANHLASSINKSLLSVHSNIADSETSLGLLEAEVADLKVLIDQLEQAEVEAMFQIQAENRRIQEEEEMRKQNAEEEYKDQKQLEKLLIDLRSSANEMYSDAPMACNDQLESFKLQTINQSSSLIKEGALINTSDINTNESNSAGMASNDLVAFSLRDFVNSNDRTFKSVPTKTIDSVSNSPPFFDDKFHEEATIDAKRHQLDQTSKNSETAMLQRQAANNKLTLDVHEFSQDNKGSGVQDLQNLTTPGKLNSALIINSSDNGNNVIIDVGGNETPHFDHDKSEDKYNVSSSPIF